MSEHGGRKMIVSTPVLRYKRAPFGWSSERGTSALTGYVCDKFIQGNFRVSHDDRIIVHFSTRKLSESVEVEFASSKFIYKWRYFDSGEEFRLTYYCLSRILRYGGIPLNQKIYVQVEIVEDEAK